MKKIFLSIIIIFIFFNIFAVSAQDNETILGEASVNGETNIDEAPAVSIETSMPDETIYIGNQTEITVTVKNIGNCDIDNLSIATINSLGHVDYNSSRFICSFNGFLFTKTGEYNNSAFNYNNFESINGSWNYAYVNDTSRDLNSITEPENPNVDSETNPMVIYDSTVKYVIQGYDCFTLNDTLKVNESSSFKISYNTTKRTFYDYLYLYFFMFSDDALLNETHDYIWISQIPRTVYINRKIENDSLVVDARISSLDNSVFSGNLSVKVADLAVPDDQYPIEIFKKAEINFINNTGNVTLKLPLNRTFQYITGLIIDISPVDVYSYDFVYDSFDESSLQYPLPESHNVDVYLNPAVSIETSISNETVYIGNETEVIVTVKNVGNCDVDNLSITHILTLGKVYWEDFGFFSITSIYLSADELDTLHFNNFESINGSWNYTYVNESDDNIYKMLGSYIINLEDTLKVNQSCSFKVIYNTTKKDFYDYSNLYFFMFSNNTMLNSTFDKINISQIPRTVYINREIQNDSLIMNAKVSSLDNSVFSGELYIKVADNLFSPDYPKEAFDECLIEFINNTGNASIKLPLTKHKEYATGLLPFGPEKYPVYSYNFVYDSFDEMLVQFIASDLVKIYKNDSQFVADARALSCDNITFKVNGISYVREVNESGFAKLNINLVPGVYTIEASTPDYKFNNTITVLPTLIGDNLVKYYMNDSQFDIKLVDSNNNPVASQNVTFNINGVFYSRQTNEEGIARLNINLSPGEYILTATDPLTGLKMSYNITVLPKLSGADVISDGRPDYKVKLVDDRGYALSGQSVSFNINGRIFNNVTDANGEARLYINLMPGKYIVTAQYLSSKTSNQILVVEK